jgi:dTDP-4-dehydrorhamnose 3,5-epimerase
VNILTTAISDLLVLESTPHIDSRGAFCRLFCTTELQSILGGKRIEQINHSRTVTVGAIRGLHFQYPPHSEVKFVRCIKGRVWDVAVDLRSTSPTFLSWFAQELSPESNRTMLIPEGFAHGFQVLESNSELLYFHTASYEPNAEGGLRYSDPRLAISWPLAAMDVSYRDSTHPLLDKEFKGMQIK